MSKINSIVWKIKGILQDGETKSYRIIEYKFPKLTPGR